jgi:ribosomal-protein-alanine N-acetyltransferase
MALIVDTERCLVRPAVEADFDALVRLWTDPDVARHLGGPRDAKKVRAALKGALDEPPEYTLWPTVEKATGRVIGDCGLLQKRIDEREEVEVVYVLAKDAWGKGYATEVAAALVEFGFRRGLPRVVALIDPGNAASGRVASKIGMVREGATTRPGGRRMDLWVARSGRRSRT